MQRLHHAADQGPALRRRGSPVCLFPGGLLPLRGERVWFSSDFCRRRTPFLFPRRRRSLCGRRSRKRSKNPNLIAALITRPRGRGPFSFLQKSHRRGPPAMDCCISSSVRRAASCFSCAFLMLSSRRCLRGERRGRVGEGGATTARFAASSGAGQRTAPYPRIRGGRRQRRARRPALAARASGPSACTPSRPA